MSKRIRYLNSNEYDRLKEIVELLRDKILISFLFETGCTVSELVDIQVKHLNPEENLITFPKEITKNKTERVVFISEELKNDILKFVSRRKKVGDSFLFSSRESTKMSTKRVRQIVQAYSKEALDEILTPQVLRYTHIVRAIEKNIPLPAIQKQVGLDTLRMSQIYDEVMSKKSINYRRFFDE